MSTNTHYVSMEIKKKKKILEEMQTGFLVKIKVKQLHVDGKIEPKPGVNI